MHSSLVLLFVSVVSSISPNLYLEVKETFTALDERCDPVIAKFRKTGIDDELVRCLNEVSRDYSKALLEYTAAISVRDISPVTEEDCKPRVKALMMMLDIGIPFFGQVIEDGVFWAAADEFAREGARFLNPYTCLQHMDGIRLAKKLDRAFLRYFSRAIASEEDVRSKNLHFTYFRRAVNELLGKAVLNTEKLNPQLSTEQLAKQMERLRMYTEEEEGDAGSWATRRLKHIPLNAEIGKLTRREIERQELFLLLPTTPRIPAKSIIPDLNDPEPEGVPDSPNPIPGALTVRATDPVTGREVPISTTPLHRPDVELPGHRSRPPKHEL